MKRLIRITLASLAISSATTAFPVFADTPPPAAQNTRPMHMGTMLDEALKGVTLRPDQQPQVDQLKSEMRSAHDATMSSRKGLADMMADQIQKGSTLDRPALQPKVDAFADAIRAERVADNAAINKLHALLDPNQRGQVANTLDARLKAHERDWHMDQAIMGKLTETLKLTPGQTNKVGMIIREEQESAKTAGAIPSQAEAKARREKAVESFRKDEFSMESAMPPDEARSKALDWTNRAMDTTQKILPVLTPEQRQMAANKLRNWK